MTTVVYAAPYAPPAPPPDPWPGIRHIWTGADGVSWEFSNPASGARLAPGARGFTMPPFERYISTAAGVPGSRYLGYRAAPREVFWPVQIFQDTSSQEWLDYDAAFWRGLSPDVPGTWTIIQPNGRSRSIRLRLAEDGDPAWEFAPGLIGWATYGVTLIADDPFWRGNPIVSPRWGQGLDDPPFTGYADAGPPFFIARASTIATARLTNPGDVEAWPLWTITGPTTAVTLRVGTDEVGVPFPLLDAQTLTIDTGVPIALLDGDDVTGLLAPHEFAPIPPGGDADIHLSMSGAGTVQAAFDTRYLRAW